MQINYLTVIIGALLNWGLGFAWYSPILFGKQWMKYSGMQTSNLPDSRKSLLSSYGILFGGALIMTYVLSQFVGLAGARGLIDGAGVGFWAWLGFVAVSTLGGVVFEQKPWSFYFINSGYYLVALMITGALLGAWR